MGDGTKIEWTDATNNAVNGCSVVSPGCTNCYAMRLAGTRLKHHPTRIGLTIDTKAGPVWNGEVRLNEAALIQPLLWSRPRNIFWNAHGDLFHPAVPVEWIDRQFATMCMADWHNHQVLTKRSARMRAYLNDPAVAGRIFGHLAGLWPGKNSGVRFSDAATRLATTWPLPNVWLGVSAEDQTRWDERVDDLRRTPAAVRWVSAEPLLGEIRDDFGMDQIDWVVAGGESGRGARPMHPDWARSLRDQCAEAGVAYLFKQWGNFVPAGHPAVPAPKGLTQAWRDSGQFPDGQIMVEVGKKAAGRHLDGVAHDGYPA